MARYTRKEFAELIGLEYNKDATAKIANWIRRGNIILDGEFIDDTNQQNEYWIQKQKGNLSKESKKNKSKGAEVGTKEKESAISEVEKEGKDIAVSPSGRSRLELDFEKKELEIEKLKVDTRLQELKEEKIRGEVIPIGLVKQIFGTHTQSIITSQKDAIEYLLINFSKEAKLTGAQLARLRGKMTDSLNESVEKAIKLSERNLKVLVEEFSIKKEVGEHE